MQFLNIKNTAYIWTRFLSVPNGLLFCHISTLMLKDRMNHLGTKEDKDFKCD